MERKCGATDTCQRRPRPAFHLRYGDRKTSDPPSGSNRLPFGSTASDRPFTPLAALCRRFTGFYRVSLCFFFVVRDFTGFHRVSLGFNGFYRVSLCSFKGFHWVSSGFTGFYWVLLGFTGFYQVSLFFYEVELCFIVFFWVLLGLTGFNWV